MPNPAFLHPSLSPLNGKPVLLDFDGAQMSSDAGLMLLREVERRTDPAGPIVSCLTDLRAPGKVRHSLEEIMGFRIMMISAGYEDGNDAGDLRHDPSFRLAPERDPETGGALCSQPAISRTENLAELPRVYRRLNLLRLKSEGSVGHERLRRTFECFSD